MVASVAYGGGVCEECLQPFTGIKRKFCSFACRQTAGVDRRRIRERIAKAAWIVHCKWCLRSIVGQKRSRAFCDDACKNAFRTVVRNHPGPIRVCVFCKALFVSNDSKTLYCSDRCKISVYREKPGWLARGATRAMNKRRFLGGMPKDRHKKHLHSQWAGGRDVRCAVCGDAAGWREPNMLIRNKTGFRCLTHRNIGHRGKYEQSEVQRV